MKGMVQCFLDSLNTNNNRIPVTNIGRMVHWWLPSINSNSNQKLETKRDGTMLSDSLNTNNNHIPVTNIGRMIQWYSHSINSNCNQIRGRYNDAHLLLTFTTCTTKSSNKCGRDGSMMLALYWPLLQPKKNTNKYWCDGTVYSPSIKSNYIQIQKQIWNGWYNDV